MTNVPPYSIFSASSELLVTLAVFYVVWKGWRGDFRRGLLAAVLVFEVAFNVSYMAYRLFWDTDGLEDIPNWLGSVAAVHGILSLMMLLFLFFIAAMAWRDRERGENFFRATPSLVWLFVVLWTISVLTGELVFVVMYLV
jgi:uncharacterized membrane protein YozB (DUF420 family)